MLTFVFAWIGGLLLGFVAGYKFCEWVSTPDDTQTDDEDGW